MNYSNSKSERYVQSIWEHVVRPLDSTALSESCFASCMMLFACIDGLGKLLHPSANAKVNERFKYFLSDWMRGLYAERQTLVWELRNNLDHNAIAALTYLSSLSDSTHAHLDADNGNLFINTRQFLMDFQTSLEFVERRLTDDCELLNQAESRLIDVYNSMSVWRRSMWRATPPGDVRFA